jgi:carbohydrate-selective porin OprB
MISSSVVPEALGADLSFHVTDWLVLQPEVQYLRHPGMDPQREASWLFGLRLELSRSWER